MAELFCPSADLPEHEAVRAMLRTLGQAPFITPFLFSEVTGTSVSGASLLLPVSSDYWTNPFDQHRVPISAGGRTEEHDLYTLSSTACTAVFPDLDESAVVLTRAHAIALRWDLARRNDPMPGHEWRAGTLLSLLAAHVARSPGLTLQLLTWEHDPVLTALALPEPVRRTDGYLVLRLHEDGRTTDREVYLLVVSASADIERARLAVESLAHWTGACALEPQRSPVLAIWAEASDLHAAVLADPKVRNGREAVRLLSTDRSRLPLSPGETAAPGVSLARAGAHIWTPAGDPSEHRVSVFPEPPAARS